ncbi:MAG: hypothetical protein AAGI06_02460 [Pseudomonadota bacterium]
MTDVEHFSPADMDKLTENYIRTARKMRAEAMASIFGGLFARISSAVNGIFSRPHTLADSPR